MLSADAQIRYLVQWFNEWSELQRSDFLPVMAEKYANKTYVNGIVNNVSNMNCRDKPMSLFECRVSCFFNCKWEMRVLVIFLLLGEIVQRMVWSVES